MDGSFSSVTDSHSVRIAFIGVFFFLALFLLVQTISIIGNLGRPGVPATDTVTVTGDGQATLPPDVARISFMVQNTATTVADAQDRTTKQANAALDFVQGQGIEGKDVKTLSYDISPQYSYPNPCPAGSLCPEYGRAPRVIGYQVSQSVQVTVRDLSKVGDVLNGLGKLSVQNVSGPAFTLEDPTAGNDAARADAITKAKAQAAMLAKELGVSLGKVVTYSESTGGYAYPMAYGLGGAPSAVMKESVTPNIPTGENTYHMTVSITYEIR